VGGRDGLFLESMLSKAAEAGLLDTVQAEVLLEAAFYSNLIAENGIAVLPGRESDEIIVLNAHVDAWFDGAGDNGDDHSNLVDELFRPLIDGQTFLHIAVRMQVRGGSPARLAIVLMLIRAGGRSLVCAKRRAHSERRARVQEGPEPGSTCMHICARGGCLHTTKALIAAGGLKALMAVNSRGESCLHTGVVSGRMPVLQALIDAGGLRLLRMRDVNGNTCLFKAAEAGRDRVVLALLKASDERVIYSRNNEGANCLYVAAQLGHLRVVNELIGVVGKRLVMQTLINGTSCLCAAVVNGHFELILCLLNAGGSELALKTHDNGTSAMHLAAYKGRRVILAALLRPEWGGKQHVALRLRSPSDADLSCLHIAAQAGHIECAIELMHMGGRELLMATDQHGRTCLTIAAKEGHLLCVEAFVKEGGRELVMKTKTNGVSCLFLAAREGHLDVVRRLLSVGGRELALLARNDGVTAADISAANGHDEVAALILQTLEHGPPPALPWKVRPQDPFHTVHVPRDVPACRIC
jgi:ankyrin repeat protein